MRTIINIFYNKNKILTHSNKPCRVPLNWLQEVKEKDWGVNCPNFWEAEFRPNCLFSYLLAEPSACTKLWLQPWESIPKMWIQIKSKQLCLGHHFQQSPLGHHKLSKINQFIYYCKLSSKTISKTLNSKKPFWISYVVM